MFDFRKSLTRLTKAAALLLVAGGFASSALQAQDNSGTLFLPSDDQLLAIGKRTMDELPANPTTGQTVLASWDARGFACLGIAQNIWYNSVNVAANPGVFIFVEDWFSVAQQLVDHGIVIPSWAQGSENCPWQTADEMNADTNLPALLATLATDPAITEQARCIYKRLMEAMDPSSTTSILANLPPGEAELIQNNFNAVAAVVDRNNNPLGMFALIDYVNFKGEGTAPKERYNTQGWGLQEVLERMDPTEMQNKGALKAFVTSAKHCLKARVNNAMIEYDRNNTPVDNPNSGLTNQREMYKQSWKAMWRAHLDAYLTWPSTDAYSLTVSSEKSHQYGDPSLMLSPESRLEVQALEQKPQIEKQDGRDGIGDASLISYSKDLWSLTKGVAWGLITLPYKGFCYTKNISFSWVYYTP